MFMEMAPKCLFGPGDSELERDGNWTDDTSDSREALWGTASKRWVLRATKASADSST